LKEKSDKCTSYKKQDVLFCFSLQIASASLSSAFIS